MPIVEVETQLSAEELLKAVQQASLHIGDSAADVYLANFKLVIELTSEQLLKTIAQLNPEELERFASQLVAVLAQRGALSPPNGETELLAKIKEELPHETQARLRKLSGKRRAETLTPNEHDELLNLSNQSEEHNALRVRHLAALASLRGTSVTALVDELGIHPARYA